MIPQFLFLTGGGGSDGTVTRILKSRHDKQFTEIFLSGVHVDRPIVQAILDILKNGKRWEGLHMSQCTGMVHDLIQHSSPFVSKLSILCDFHRMERSSCRSLSRGLQNPSCRLTKLMLRIQLSHDLATCLCEGLSAEHCQLEELVLPISNASLKSILLLSVAFRQCKTLTKLKLNRHDLVWTIDPCQIVILMKSLKDHPSLKELSIQGSSCDEIGIRAISDCVVGNLEKLDLSNHRFGGARLHGMTKLTTSLRRKHNNNLRLLSLSGHRLMESDVLDLASAMADNNSRIEDLSLMNCQLSDESIVVLANFLPRIRDLKYLWLHDNPFGQTGSSALLVSLQQNWELEQLLLPRGRGLDDMQRQIEFLLALNRAGRRLLRTTSHTIPLSLWPKVLGRASKKTRQTYCYYGNNQQGFHADAIFHLLKGPALFER